MATFEGSSLEGQFNRKKLFNISQSMIIQDLNMMMRAKVVALYYGL